MIEQGQGRAEKAREELRELVATRRENGRQLMDAIADLDRWHVLNAESQRLAISIARAAEDYFLATGEL